MILCSLEKQIYEQNLQCSSNKNIFYIFMLKSYHLHNIIALEFFKPTKTKIGSKLQY